MKLLHPAPTLPHLSRHIPRRSRRFSLRTSPYALRRRQHFVRSVGLVTALGATTLAWHWYTGTGPFGTAHAEGPPKTPLFPFGPNKAKEYDADAETAKLEAAERGDKPLVVEPRFEEIRKIDSAASPEQARAQLSSQHLQMQKSWENPGVWMWGANDGRVAAPDAREVVVKNPRWTAFFDGMLLRDMKLSRDFGAAIDEKGDLIQWGSAFSKVAIEPVRTLRGKRLRSLAISQDRILALSSSGKVYSLSVSQDEQTLGPKPTESSWIPFWTSKSPISYRLVQPTTLGWRERVSAIAGGLDHVALLTNAGRVYTAAAGNESFPTRGEFGIGGLTWFTRPPGPYDMPHEVAALSGFKVTQIAAGDHHTLALDRQGRLFAWGDNTRGQLGTGDTSKDTPFFDTPQLIPIPKLYKGTALIPKVTAIFAGGETSFLTIDAARTPNPHDGGSYDTVSAHRDGLSRVTADTWACGHGIWGQLGNGRWTHVAATPTKIAPLSGLFEYDERARRAIPIRVRSVSVGATHCSAMLDNITFTGASESESKNETNWGADVLFFGNNEFYQLGTGRRNNLVVPTYIPPMDRAAEISEGARGKTDLHRFHATPRSTVRIGERWVTMEQHVECGRGVTAVYSRVCG